MRPRAPARVLPPTQRPGHSAPRAGGSFRSPRTFADIPEHIKRHVESLYLAMQSHLGADARIRKRCFVAMLRAYYKWEDGRTLARYFDAILTHREQVYLMERRCAQVESEYHAQVLQLFGAVDSDGDCTIDLNEFRSAVACVPGDVDWAQVFADADADGSGSLDVVEFYALVAHTHRENERKRWRKRSRLFAYDRAPARPSLADLRKRSEILSSDVPMYVLRAPDRACDAHKRYFGH